MKKRTILIYASVMICSLQVYAQQALKIGDRFLGLQTEHVINDTDGRLNKKNLEGKLLMLDFWSTSCTSCIEHMPAMAKIQKEFKDKLVFVYVDNEKKSTIDKFFSKRKELRALSLPMIIEDTLLSKLFPHETVPHVIWIGKEGIVKAITDGESISEDHIRGWLKEDSIVMPVKSDLHMNRERNLYTLGNVFTDNLKYYSILTGELNGGGGSSSFRFINGNRIRLYIVNQQALSLFASAWHFEISLSTPEWKTRIIVENTVDSFHNNNRNYSYEMIAPAKDSATDMQRAYKLMQQDLDRYFSVKSRVEKRRLSCYVVTCIQPPKTTDRQTTLFHYYDGYKIIEHYTASHVIADLQIAYDFEKPVVYEGILDPKITIRLQNHYSNLDDVKKDLKCAGLTLTEEQRTIDMLVISEN